MMQYPVKDPSFEYKLIGDIVKEYPRMSQIMERYLGKDCLKKTGV